MLRVMVSHVLVHTVGVIRYVWTHPSNRGRRIAALGRAARFQIAGRCGRRTLARIGDSMRMWAVLHRTASSKVIYANPPDYPEMMAWKRILKPGDFFVDVGSNVGSYALWAADCGARVLAVEPSSSAVELLRENVALNSGIQVEVSRCALSDAAGTMRLTEGDDAMNHLRPHATDGELVPVQTLDELLGGRTAAGVKIDVEGFERLVLEGARTSLSQHKIKVLQLEWNDLSQARLGEDRRPVEAILGQYGYTLARPDRHGELQVVTAPMIGPDVFAVASSY